MLYLVDQPSAEIAFRTAADDPDAHVVLLQDGVYVRPGDDVPEISGRLSAIERDVTIRGITPPADVTLITYDELVGLLDDHEVRSFV